jgi:hypothetical protein
MMTVSQPEAAAGFTHASRVIPVVRSSGLAAVSVTVTQSLVPSKESALPIFPVACEWPGRSCR